MVYLLIILFVVIVLWQIWRNRSAAALREMNVGARLFQSRQYTDAEVHFQQLLTKRLPPGVEADTRRRLADTLDVLGKNEEASRQRERASAVAMKGARDQTALTAQGDILGNQHRYDDACEMYQRALRLLPPVNSPRRAQILAKLTLAHHRAGRSGEALKCAEESLACNPGNTIRLLMERMAGICSSDQGDLEAAETHYIHALDLAEVAGKPKDIAQGLALLANLQQKQGHYEKAIATARRSREIGQNPARTDLAVEAECLRDMGRFDEARVVMRRHFDGPHLEQPRHERKMQALGSLGMAWIETRAEQPEAAWEHLEATREGLKLLTSSTSWPPPPGADEEKLVLWCDATAVNIFAQQGRTVDAHRLRDSIEARLVRFAGDYATLRGVYGHLARATLRMGDFVECRDYCRRYQDSHPPPSIKPTIYYIFGEVALRLAETDAACDFFRQAVAPGIDSLDARRAQARLDEMGVEA